MHLELHHTGTPTGQARWNALLFPRVSVWHILDIFRSQTDILLKIKTNNKYVSKDLVSWWEKQDFQSKMNSNTTIREHWWGISSDLVYSVYLWKVSTESGEKQSLLITLQIWAIKEAVFLNISGKRNNILWSGDRLDFRMKQFRRIRHLLN